MRIRKFNESEEYNLSYIDFQEVMTEITDDIDNQYEYRDHSVDNYPDGDTFYSLDIDFKNSEYIETSNILGFDYLGGSAVAKMGSSEDGGDSIMETKYNKIERIIDTINLNERSVNRIKREIDNQIINNKKLIDILRKLEKLKPRLSSYTNFLDIRIGMEGIDDMGTRVVISFEIKKEQ